MFPKIDMGLILITLLTIVFIVLITFGWYSLYQEQQACEARGGAYVKGFMSYTCIEGRGR